MVEYKIRILNRDMSPNCERKEAYVDDATATAAACDLAAGRPVKVWRNRICILREPPKVPSTDDQVAQIVKRLAKSVMPKAKRKPVPVEGKKRSPKARIPNEAEGQHIRLPQRSELVEGVEKEPGEVAQSTEELDPKTASQ